MSSRADRDLLGDILEALRRARSYTADQSYEQFLGDTKTQDAVIRTLEILGEATKKLSPALRESHPEIPWKSMAGVRDKLIHDYSIKTTPPAVTMNMNRVVKDVRGLTTSRSMLLFGLLRPH